MRINQTNGDMNKQHSYEVGVVWTGNLGNGTSTYRGYSRDYDLACEGKPVVKGSADPGYLGDAARHDHELDTVIVRIQI